MIQREAGHVYPESGDNYLFMVDSRFDSRIQPGTALSRSRFEDATFSHGENLKSGVHTRWGTVRVQQHTELELRFTDPATGQLHPVCGKPSPGFEPVRQLSRLFRLPPHSGDRQGRHLPATGLPDRWGMMCEADLEEVYRRRSLSVGLMKTYLLTVITLFVTGSLLQAFSGLSETALYLLNGVLLVLGAWAFASFGPRRLAARMQAMTEVIRTLAEGEGNLRQRVDSSAMPRDESGDMARWINSFIDSTDGVVGQVIRVETRAPGQRADAGAQQRSRADHQ